MRKMLIFLLLAGFFTAQGQSPKAITTGNIYKSIQNLNFLGTVLYVAAHPDDENTRLISYCVNELNADTYYLSLTRGDGGQNLIGPEIRELLGVLRTEELLAARRVDGGKQMFTRANDFGYSKNAEETINIWDSDKVKHDVVWAIRKVKPDVIINRFDHRTSGSTHGHHTASAMLAYELFDRSGDKTAFPEQLKHVSTWTPNRLFFNTSFWFYGSQEKFDQADKSNLAMVDVGGYFPLLGLSNGEIAALSRSNHKCQGFGSAGSRGSQSEYLELLRGNMPKNKSDIFEGINTTWTRVKGGEAILAIMSRVQKNFDFNNPSASVKDLIEARKLIAALGDEFWRTKKLREIDNVIASCLGLFVEASAQANYATPGDSMRVDFEVVMQNKGQVKLTGISLLPIGKSRDFDSLLTANEKLFLSEKVMVSSDMDFTSPYWLRKKGTDGIYHVDNPLWIGLPETPRPIQAKFDLIINGSKVSFVKDLIYKYTDSEKGEVYQPFEILPEFSVKTKEGVMVFSDTKSKEIEIEVKAYAAEANATLTLEVPQGWKISPSIIQIGKLQQNQTASFKFSLTPPEMTSIGTLIPVLTAGGKNYKDEVIEIDYAHVPLQRVIKPAETSLSRINIKRSGDRVAYLMGTGDDIPASLKQIGYNVDLINVDDITAAKLSQYDALIMGIRAYNKYDDLKFKQSIIFDFVKQGGNFIVQYNTMGRDLVMREDEMMPYPFKISRERVTKEDAKVTFLAPEHEILQVPNKITQEDFEGWVQERGLYFPGEWSDQFTPILSCNDPGEPPRNGGLLVAPYGEGYCIYTAYSWFRELPAGVPGAFRLFANMISMGKNNRP
ncbi:MAG: PIG-L family deacetylase [Saprospiraceae bacterium]|nr:PIG-L family deacetylase [Saprospiraceae bacterium]